MNIVSGVVIFQIIWWILFFIALPIGVQRDYDGVKGRDLGAPKKTYLKKKLLYTTLLTIVLFFVSWWMIDIEVISFRKIVSQEKAIAPQSYKHS